MTGPRPLTKSLQRPWLRGEASRAMSAMGRKPTSERRLGMSALGAGDCLGVIAYGDPLDRDLLLSASAIANSAMNARMPITLWNQCKMGFLSHSPQTPSH